MVKLNTNVIILVFGWLLVTAAGVYFTFFRQPEELEQLQKAEQVARMKNAELISLQSEAVELTDLTNETLRKWQARYKIIPDEIESAEVVGRLNELTQAGFKNFDVSFGGTTTTEDVSFYSFSVTGRGYFSSLYRLIWELENGREMYRIRDLNLDHIDLMTQDATAGAERLEVMVSFTMSIDAYFNGIKGASAPEVMVVRLEDESYVPMDRDSGLPPVPRELLPARQPALNPFFPIIMQQIPPNTYGLIDVEQARLVSIVGEKAVFQDDSGYRTAGVGDSVYLGRIVVVDPVEGRVVAHLNKGGIYDEVELHLQSVERFRQAQGPVKLAPGAY